MAKKDTIHFTLTQTTKSRPPRLPFSAIKNAVMGQVYDVSLVFIADKRARSLNRSYRGTDTAANVLSFPLGKREGEVFLNISRAKREAPRFGMSYRAYVAFLFIHGLLHLKGRGHSSTMEREERKWMKKFNFS